MEVVLNKGGLKNVAWRAEKEWLCADFYGIFCAFPFLGCQGILWILLLWNKGGFCTWKCKDKSGLLPVRSKVCADVFMNNLMQVMVFEMVLNVFEMCLNVSPGFGQQVPYQPGQLGSWDRQRSARARVISKSSSELEFIYRSIAPNYI